MYPGEEHNIPHGSELDCCKLAKYGVVNTDTCHGARKLNQLLREEIQNLAIERGIITEDEQLTFQQDCHHHMRNVWIGAMNRILSKFLANLMQVDLGNIDSNLRVTTNFDTVLRAVDKLFSLSCKYAKGAGMEFRSWMDKYHPGAYIHKVEQTVGSRQDLTVEGASAIYMNRRYYVQF